MNNTLTPALLGVSARIITEVASAFNLYCLIGLRAPYGDDWRSRG